MERMRPKDIPPEDDFQIRCPKLGHLISFSYCENENIGTPCFKALDCWFDYFPVRAFFLDKLGADQFKKSFETPSQPKLASILSIIEKFKEENH